MNNDASLTRILLDQYKQHPRMQLQDMIKLLYQNEFAGGHMISDEAECMERLTEEYRSLNYDCMERTAPLFEEIGNGLVRLNLAALKYQDIALETVNRFFINTANSIKGSIRSFEVKLDLLRVLCENKELPCSAGEVNRYLERYRQEGYPAVSHSDTYRLFYRPAYRIVKEEYLHYFEVFCRIDSLLKRGKAINVAADGNCGSGKSALAALLSGIYDCNVFHMDDFFLPPERKTESRLREIGGNVDYERFKEEVANHLNSEKAFSYRPYNCGLMRLDDAITVKPKRLNIIEGSYSMHPTLTEYYDLKIFLSVDPAEQSRRILKRNGPEQHKRFLNEWIPMENRYFEGLRIREQCDLIFSD